jgi:hypothetical protein
MQRSPSSYKPNHNHNQALLINVDVNRTTWSRATEYLNARHIKYRRKKGKSYTSFGPM